MPTFDTTPYYSTTCNNCGHESHCGTKLYKSIKDNTTVEYAEICVCDSCRCVNCTGKQCVQCNSVTVDYKLVDYRDLWGKLRGQQVVCKACAK